MEQDRQRSPESCVYSVGVVGEGNRIHQRGTLEVTPSQLIYTPDGEQDSYIWPLRYIKKYSVESESRFVIEAGSSCPSGPGLYTFSTEHARELHDIIARNVTTVVTSPRHSVSNMDTQTTPTPSPTFAPPTSPSMSSSPYFSRSNGVTSPHSPHPPHQRHSSSSPHHRHSSHSSLSPTSSPTLSRSSSIRSLPENAFEVKNIGENESLSKDGILEVTPQELIYMENSSQQRWVWPLMYLRRYGRQDNVFSIEAGRRCPGGPGFYSFSAPRINELYELVQTYAKNFYSSQISLASIDYSLSAPPPSVSLTSQRHTPSPSADGGRSESPVFHRSDSFIRRAFSAMELRKNIFEVHNLGDNEQVLGKGTLEVTNNELIYSDSTTGDKWRWPIRYLRRYGCNGVRVFSFEAGRRCPGGEGLYAFATSRANEIHEAIIESVNASSTTNSRLGNLSVSRLSLADTSSPPGSRGGWVRKASVPTVMSSHHTHFLTPPPMRRPPQPTLDEVPSAQPQTSTPTRQSYSSDETDAVDGSSTHASTPPPSSPIEQKQKASKPLVQHTYDVPQEAKDAYLRQQNNGGASEVNKKVKPPLKKKPLLPPTHRGKLRFQRFSSEGHKSNESSPNNNTQRRLNGHTTRMSDSHSTNSIPESTDSPQDKEKEETFYQNIQIRTLPEAERSGSELPSVSTSIQPSDSHSLYANLSPIQKATTPPPPSSSTNVRTEPSMYANVSELMALSESGRSNSTPSSPSTLITSYTEIEIIDKSENVVSPDSTAWSPSSPGEKRSLTNSGRGFTSSGRGLTSSGSGQDSVVYDALNFSKMEVLASLKDTRTDTQNFADLLERHAFRDRESGSRKKKQNNS